MSPAARRRGTRLTLKGLLMNSLFESRFFGPTDEDLAKDVGIASHDFPLYAPLSHSNPFFSSETFNVEEFLLSRSHTSLPDLRSELRDYLAALKEELVMLINDDYEAFISLSTDLKGEGVRLERMQSPLGDLKAHILVRCIRHGVS